MDKLNELIASLANTHDVKLSEESVTFAFNDGFISLSLDDGTLSVNVEFTDRVIAIDDNLGDLTGMVH